MKKILAFSGSTSSQSINQQLVEATVPFFNSSVEVISLRDFDAPLFSIDLRMSEGVPSSIDRLYAKMQAVDGFLISVPEHNGSMPAAFKNTIDWLSMLDKKIFLDKPTVFLSTSPGPLGAASALGHIVDIMPYRGANIVGSFSLGSFEENVSDGKLSDEATSAIQPLIAKLEETIKA